MLVLDQLEEELISIAAGEMESVSASILDRLNDCYEIDAERFGVYISQYPGWKLIEHADPGKPIWYGGIETPYGRVVFYIDLLRPVEPDDKKLSFSSLRRFVSKGWNYVGSKIARK